MSGQDGFLSISGEAQSEIIIKKSRFLCNLVHTETKELSDEFIAAVKKQHYNATHNCSAVIIGENGNYQHSSDDGEPQGTAGLPMLEVLRNNSLTFVTAVVTRYFGGILLGAGGLVRAYSASVADAVKNAVITENIPAQIYDFEIDYADYSKLVKLSDSYGAVPKSEFSEKVRSQVIIELNAIAAFEKNISQAFMGDKVYKKSGVTLITKNLN